LIFLSVPMPMGNVGARYAKLLHNSQDRGAYYM
jgi:hypothetical protein